jgi:hypothetical protein
MAIIIRPITMVYTIEEVPKYGARSLVAESSTPITHMPQIKEVR